MLFIIKLTKGEVSRSSVARLVVDVNRMDHKAGHLFSVPFKETTPLCPGAQGWIAIIEEVRFVTICSLPKRHVFAGSVCRRSR